MAGLGGGARRRGGLAAGRHLTVLGQLAISVGKSVIEYYFILNINFLTPVQCDTVADFMDESEFGRQVGIGKPGETGN